MQQNPSDLRNNNPVVFARGMFGEIYLPAQAGTVADAANEGPNHFWARLKTILGGGHQGEVERALYEAIIFKCEPLSLMPPSSRPQSFESFAPVLTHLGDFRWRMGLVGHGRLESFVERDTANVVDKVREIFLDWSRADSQSAERHNLRKRPQGGKSDEI